MFLGLAPVAGMCTSTSSCTVNEGRHFESVYVVAHEIGHKYVYFIRSLSFFYFNILIVYTDIYGNFLSLLFHLV